MQHLQHPADSVDDSSLKLHIPLESELLQHRDPLILEQSGTGDPMQAFSCQLGEMMVQQQQMFTELHQSSNQEKHRNEAEAEERHLHESHLREEEQTAENLQSERKERQQLEQQHVQSSADLLPHERLTLSGTTINSDATQPSNLFLIEIDKRLDEARRPKPRKPSKSKAAQEPKGAFKVLRQNFNCFDCKRELKGKCCNCRIRLLQCLVTQQKKQLAHERNLRIKAEKEVISLKRKRTEDKKKLNTSSKRCCRLKGYALVIITFFLYKVERTFNNIFFSKGSSHDAYRYGQDNRGPDC